MKKLFCLVCVLCGLTTIQARQRQNFDADWLFLLGDSAQMSQVDYNDSFWRKLNVPHDWAIEGDFYVGNPSGAGGGALPGGIGWYRKHFTLDKIEKVFIEFDGVYMNSTVYVNGKEVGFRPYGYSSFEYDITPYVKKGENVVAVRVNNSDQPVKVPWARFREISAGLGEGVNVLTGERVTVSDATEVAPLSALVVDYLL